MQVIDHLSNINNLASDLAWLQSTHPTLPIEVHVVATLGPRPFWGWFAREEEGVVMITVRHPDRDEIWKVRAWLRGRKLKAHLSELVRQWESILSEAAPKAVFLGGLIAPIQGD